MFAERSFHSCPCEKPSNVTVPIITHTNGTVPATTSSFGSPPSGRRRPSTPSRVSKTDIRANML